MRGKKGPGRTFAAGVFLLGTFLLPLAGGSALTAQESLDRVARRLASAWTEGDVATLADLMLPEAIRLELEGASHPAVGAHQARAALRRFLGREGSGVVAIREVQELGGTPPEGYVELRWTPRSPGQGAPSPYTVFLGFRVDGDRWRLSEIRVLTEDDAARRSMVPWH